MSKVFSYKIIPWFSAACLSLLLPFVVRGNDWAQDCSEKDVKAQIQQLQDDKGGKAASDVLVNCGESAIASLTQALSDDNPAIRAYVASTMGKMGADAQDGVSGLVEALGDSDERVRSNAASALVQIVRKVQGEADKFTQWDLGAVQRLEGLKQSLQKAITALEKDKQDWKSKKKDIENLQLAHRGLQTKLNQLTEQNLYQVVKWVQDNPWVWLAVGYLVGYLGIFIVRPIWLLKLDEWVKPATFTIPVVKLPVSLRYLLFLKYHPRVLDAWVQERIHKAKEQFEGRDTVKKHEIYVAEPILLNEQKVESQNFNAKVLKGTFDKSQVRVVIWGEGGSGKTSLACQIAQWAFAAQKSDRICQHQMLPILIEDELDGSLLETIGGLLKELTQEGKPIPEELLKQLLRQQRILLIVDHLSEMGEETRKKIQPDNQDFPANALIVTSRLKNILGSEITPTFIEPFRISVGSLASFLNRYLLEKKVKPELFDGFDYSEAYRRLEGMASVRQVETTTPNKQGLTILLVKLYAEQMIAAKEGTYTDELPDNVPDLMLQYLNELNKSTSGELSNQKVHEIAQLVAWQCIEPTFKPESADCKQVLTALEGLESDAETRAEKAQQHLKYLESRLYLVRKKKPDLQTLRFTLDPLAEYLAGLHLVQQHGNDEDAWREILAQTEDKPGFSAEIKGFLLALRDCCEVKKRAGVPEFVVKELGKKAGLDPEAVQQFQRKRRVRILIQELSAPEPEYRARAVEDLGKMGKDAKPAVSRLRKLLENDSEEAKTLREAANVLKQLGEKKIPIMIAEIKDGVESIRSAEHPPIEEIDLGNGVILETVEIPGGTFKMGSLPNEEESKDSERPQHQVTVIPFLMGKYPITQAQWEAVAALPQVKRELKPNPSRFQGANRPVEGVNWYDAVEFCARLSQEKGREFRLPSEAEWEYACRAGTNAPFHFGETMSTDLANYNGSHFYGSGVKGINRSETTPVGMFQVANNAFGLYDMHGNVWEWCLDDWHNNYEGAPTDGSAWFDDNNNLCQKPGYAVLRGGSWFNNPRFCRSACRNNNPRAGRGNFIDCFGFRVVCAFGRIYS